MPKVYANKQNLSERDALAQKYKNARYNLICAIVATLVNLLFVLIGEDTYFLFSIAIPYLFSNIAAFYCGHFPEEMYAEIPDMVYYPKEIFYVVFALSLAVVALYLVAFFLSKKEKVGWLIFALVFFSLDTLLMFVMYGISGSFALDYIFHAWLLVILILGVRAHFKWKKMPPDPVEEMAEAQAQQPFFEATDSTPLRVADMGAKQRVFLQAQVNSKSIVYRRVNKTNELVINGQVYDEYVALSEHAHILSAHLDGHTYEAGINPLGRMFIMVDGQRIAKKMRLI